MVTAVESGTGTGAVLRPFVPEDRAWVLELVEADLLPGRPRPVLGMLDCAVGGGHGGFERQAGLKDLRTDVLVGADGELAGVVSYAVWAADGEGMLLWLHCREDDQMLAEQLVRHAACRLGRRRTMHAFALSTALAPAGLPVRNRPGTVRALEACGFSGTDRWRYLRYRLDPRRPGPYRMVNVTECPDEPGWHLHLRELDGTRIGEARIGDPVAGTVNLEWINLAPGKDRLGHILLEQCLDHLADRGIHEVTALLESPTDDQPHHEAALRLHEAAGFTEIDQLRMYTRRP